jgi:hypothetical protein
MTYSVSRLARLAAAGNRQAITGVWRTCRAASITERGEPCPQCGARGGELVAPRTCRFWKPAAFDRLQAEGVAVVERRGEGLHLTYRVRVFTLLPLLTPAQVADLHTLSQERYSRWLLKQDLDLAGWERLTVRHLALPALAISSAARAGSDSSNSSPRFHERRPSPASPKSQSAQTSEVVRHFR